MLISVGWILLNKELVVRHSPIVVTGYGMATGTLMLLVWVPLRYGPTTFSCSLDEKPGWRSPPAACSARPPHRCSGTGA